MKSQILFMIGIMHVSVTNMFLYQNPNAFTGFFFSKLFNHHFYLHFPSLTSKNARYNFAALVTSFFTFLQIYINIYFPSLFTCSCYIISMNYKITPNKSEKTIMHVYMEQIQNEYFYVSYSNTLFKLKIISST